ncbi:hypothetical protein HYH03_011442 [Edaphochlamys debaryana]|uniref:Uncharacterized protein n=1 Tax=Edaphochlamys debaryana TaxID=47281 RepID=A0A836BVK6_9CHLO|nr:hypothetical protein HYH03_011442 [Edaphochlamys debaryana]|eukprot:KAG2490137.1 hypothetical protein HYH03_011442 [Edaphochlamys debaryana]
MSSFTSSRSVKADMACDMVVSDWRSPQSSTVGSPEGTPRGCSSPRSEPQDLLLPEDLTFKPERPLAANNVCWALDLAPCLTSAAAWSAQPSYGTGWSYRRGWSRMAVPAAVARLWH